MSHFGERLKELCFEKQVNLKQLGKKLNVSSSNMYEWNKHDKMPSLKTLLILAEYFDCSLDFLLGRTDSKSKYKKQELNAFSSTFKKLIKKNDKTIYDLSRKTGIDRPLIYRWLNGVYKPSVINLIKLADYFDCTFDEIVGLENFEKNN